MNNLYNFYAHKVDIVFTHSHANRYTDGYTRWYSGEGDLNIPERYKRGECEYIDIFCHNMNPADPIIDDILFIPRLPETRRLEFAFKFCLGLDKAIIIEEGDYSLLINVEKKHHRDIMSEYALFCLQD